MARCEQCGEELDYTDDVEKCTKCLMGEWEKEKKQLEREYRRDKL